MPCCRSCTSEKRAVVFVLFLCHPQNTLLVYLSDHCFVECSLTNPAPGTTIKEMCFRKWKNIDLDVFKKDILESDLYSLTDDQSHHQSTV